MVGIGGYNPPSLDNTCLDRDFLSRILMRCWKETHALFDFYI